MPGIASLIDKSIDEIEAELNQLGKPVAIDSGVIIYFLFNNSDLIFFSIN